MSDLSRVEKIAHCVTISREQAIEYGLVEPTSDEAARMAEDAERHRQLTDAHQAAVADWRSRWDRRSLHPITAVVVDLHAPAVGFCHYDNDPWPCDTVKAVAAAEGLPYPEYGA